jgi:hypothetical protein
LRQLFEVFHVDRVARRERSNHVSTTCGGLSQGSSTS